MTSATTGWRRRLPKGEQILWQGGRVGSGLSDHDRSFSNMFGGMALVIGGPFFLVGLIMEGPVLGWRLIPAGLGGLVTMIALVALILPRIHAKEALRRTRYALTDKRALMDYGRWHEAWPITPDTEVTIRTGNPGSIIFGQETLPPSDEEDQPAYREIGFIDIGDVTKVARLIRNVQSLQLAKMEIAT